MFRNPSRAISARRASSRRGASTSPVSASSPQLASPASDVYSAASVLYAMLSGRAPFAGHDERSLRREVAAGDVEALGARAPFAGSAPARPSRRLLQV